MTVLSVRWPVPMPDIPTIRKGPDMAMITQATIDVIGGVDTHMELHMAAVVDTAGQVLGTKAFSTKHEPGIGR